MHGGPFNVEDTVKRRRLVADLNALIRCNVVTVGLKLGLQIQHDLSFPFVHGSPTRQNSYIVFATCIIFRGVGTLLRCVSTP